MTLDEAWEIVATACRKHNKAFGGPMVAAGEMQNRKDQGAQLLVNSSEFHGWSTGLSQDSLKYDALH
jgi:hypothetical protein